MSSGITDKEDEIEIKIDIRSDLEIEYVLSQMIVPYTNFVGDKHEPDD